jgi:hypothetical protein
MPVVVRDGARHADGRKTSDRSLLGVDAVVIQHEYGIFGGPDGSWITTFAERLSELRVPYSVTLRTVLSRPTEGQAAAAASLCRGAAAVTVFTSTARTLAVRSPRCWPPPRCS